VRFGYEPVVSLWLSSSSDTAAQKAVFGCRTSSIKLSSSVVSAGVLFGCRVATAPISEASTRTVHLPDAMKFRASGRAVKYCGQHASTFSAAGRRVENEELAGPLPLRARKKSVLTGLSSVACQELALALVPELPGNACSHHPARSVSMRF
jgi:hypothetical protein